MVQGTSSWAGKSLLVTALARHFSRLGIKVAPFKAENMSNNARVAEGGEIGVAQYLQALAARAEPDVRMNPVLVKPETATSSQVVVRGKVDRRATSMDWRERGPVLWEAIEDSYRGLASDFDLILLEGAGSPAEINLVDRDLANMRSARMARAPILMCTDISRGGAFAHLYGTWSLLGPHDREQIKGFVLNRFRGDKSLLDPGPAQLRELTGTAVIGVLPPIEHGLPDEDGASPSTSRPGLTKIAIVRYPAASNLDEFKLMEQIADVTWATHPRALKDAEVVVLPGSKHSASDARWLLDSGFAPELRSHVQRGLRLFAVCGGLQMLGHAIEDPHDVEAAGEGLGLLDIRTVLGPHKEVRRRTAQFAQLPHPWRALSGMLVRGYEIRFGETVVSPALPDALPDGLGFVSGGVLGVYVHGLLEDLDVLEALFNRRPERSLDYTFDLLADAVEAHLDVDFIHDLVGMQ
jgi:adenosylcobyric acid synthase